MRLIDVDTLKDMANDTDYVPTGKWLHLSEIEAIPTIDQNYEIVEIKAKAYAKGFVTALEALLDMLKDEGNEDETD